MLGFYLCDLAKRTTIQFPLFKPRQADKTGRISNYRSSSKYAPTSLARFNVTLLISASYRCLLLQVDYPVEVISHS